MTKRYFKYTLSTLLALGLSSCASEDFWDTFDRTVDGTIELSAGIASSVEENKAATRGEQSTLQMKAMQEGTFIHLKVEGYWNRIKSSDPVSQNTIYKAKSLDTSSNSLEFAGTESMEPLYWDDFGVGDPANKNGDIHNKEKGLTIYGVAVDGVTEASAISVDDKDIYWTSLLWNLATDGNNVLSKDILVSKNISGDNTYKFKDRGESAKMSFIHPLSMITFNINAGDGFPNGFVSEPSLTLSDAAGNGYSYVEGTIDIKNGTAANTGNVMVVTAGTTSNTADNKTYVKKALVYPGTQLGDNNDDVIAVLKADGNVYYIKAKEIHAAMTGHSDYKTKAGHNYEITITVNKQSVSVSASIVDWNSISANASAKVQFTADVTTEGSTTGFVENDAFSLWMTKNDPAVEKTATVTYDGSKLNCDPVLYWPNGNDAFKFRALAKKENSKIEAVTVTDVSQGTDLLWGTTSDNNGEAVSPRTGSVPLTFKHVMSNVVIKLTTTTDDSKVELADATVTLTKLAKKGTISIADGTITASTLEDNAFSSKIDEEKKVTVLMIPQTIGDEAKVIVTLKDDTTYSLQLNQCLNGSTAVDTWASGNIYTYTIHLEKEKVKFRALVEAWKEKTGSGSAYLEWD